MGGKNQTSTSTNTPTALPQLQQIWDRVQQVASTPYQPFGGQLVAGLNPTQQAGITNTNAAVGKAQPYIDQATQYATTGAANISPNDIARYTNPYANSVIKATQANFDEGNAQQRSALKGNAITSGAFGGDRAGVAQGELARQQKLAQDPVIAGLNNQNFVQALQAAQADRAAQAQGAFSFGNLGGAAQNAALQGAQAQLGAGAVQQGTEQNQLSADYNQYLQKLAFPYQQAQFLQSALPALTAQGGTTTNTTPGPSPWGQIAGLGLTAAGIFTGNPMLAMSGIGGMTGGGGGGFNSIGGGQAASASQPWGAAYAPGGFKYNYASGGAVSGGDDMGDFVKSVHSIRNAISRGGIVLPQSGGIPQGFAVGGDIPFSLPTDRINNGFADADEAIATGVMDPQGTNQGSPVLGYSGSVPLPQPRPQMAQAPIQLPPQIAGAPSEEMPPEALGFASSGPQSPYSAPPQFSTSGMPPVGVPPTESPSGSGGPFNLSDEARQGLLAAGLGMLASKSPFALSAIGEGGLHGLQTYAAAKKTADEKAQAQSRIDLQAAQMAQQAEQFAKNLDLHTKTADETAKYHRGLLERENNKFIGVNEDGFPVFKDTRTGKETIGETKLQGKAPSGYVKNADGTMSPVKGGPADPEIIKNIAAAKTGKPLPDDTADFLAERVLAGDGKALVGLGRGAQGAENILRIQSIVAQKAKERGMDASDILAKTAEQSGLTAQQRTFGTQVARMAVNATEAQGAIKLGREASALVPRGNWVPINKAIQAYQSGTSDPLLAKFGAANLAIVNTYARAISPTGQPTIHDKEHAEKLLSTATGPEAYNAILDQMNAEIEIAHNAPLKAKKEMEAIRRSGKETGTEVPKEESKAAPPAPPATEREKDKVYRTPKGDFRWTGEGWAKP